VSNGFQWLQLLQVDVFDVKIDVFDVKKGFTTNLNYSITTESTSGTLPQAEEQHITVSLLGRVNST